MVVLSWVVFGVGLVIDLGFLAVIVGELRQRRVTLGAPFLSLMAYLAAYTCHARAPGPTPTGALILAGVGFHLVLRLVVLPIAFERYGSACGMAGCARDPDTAEPERSQ